MSAVRVIRFRVQECVHSLARYPRRRLLRGVSGLAGVRKQRKRTTETGFSKGVFYEEVHVSFGWLTRLCSPFLKFFWAHISKKNEIFSAFALQRLVAGKKTRCSQGQLESISAQAPQAMTARAIQP